MATQTEFYLSSSADLFEMISAHCFLITTLLHWTTICPVSAQLALALVLTPMWPIRGCYIQVIPFVCKISPLSGRLSHGAALIMMRNNWSAPGKLNNILTIRIFTIYPGCLSIICPRYKCAPSIPPHLSQPQSLLWLPCAGYLPIYNQICVLISSHLLPQSAIRFSFKILMVESESREVKLMVEIPERLKVRIITVLCYH